MIRISKATALDVLKHTSPRKLVGLLFREVSQGLRVFHKTWSLACLALRPARP